MAAPIQTPQQAPVAAYSFDEGEGTTAEDLSGGGHTATLEGAEWARGKYGDGLRFDGVNDCVSIANSTDLNFTEEFSLEAWVRPEGAGPEALPVITMLDSEAAGEEEEFAYELLAGQKEVPKAWVRKGGSTGFQSIAGKEPLPEHAWAHLALTDDGAMLRLYVNGALVRTTAAPTLTTASGPLEIGCEPYAHFKGRIDEVRLYNRVKNASEEADDIPPRFAEPFFSFAIPAEESEELSQEPAVFFSEAADPPLPGGQEASGLEKYLYRVRINGGEFTNWDSTEGPVASAPNAFVGDTVTLQILAVDGAGNFSDEIEKSVELRELAEPSSEEGFASYWNEADSSVAERAVAPPNVESKLTEQIESGAACGIDQTKIAEKQLEAHQERINFIQSDVYYRCRKEAALIGAAVVPYLLSEGPVSTFPRVTDRTYLEGGPAINTKGPFPVTALCKRNSFDRNWKAGATLYLAHFESIGSVAVPVVVRVPPIGVEPKLPIQKRQCIPAG